MPCDLEQGRCELISVEPKGSGLALVSDASALIDQVNAVWPAGVRLLGRVTEFIEYCGEFDPELPYARSGYKSAFLFGLRSGEYHLIFNVALHLPHVTGMRFGDVHHQEPDLALIPLVEFVEGGNLPPEGRSSVAAEDEH